MRFDDAFHLEFLPDFFLLLIESASSMSDFVFGRMMHS